MKRLAALTLGAVLLLPAGAGAGEAPDSSSLPPARKLQRVLARLSEQRRRLDSARTRERRLLQDLEGIDRTLDQAQARLADLERERRATEARARRVAADLAATERRMRDRRSRLGARLRALYIYGRSGYVDVLLGADDVAGFIARWSLVAAVVRADAAALGEYAAEARRHRDLLEALGRDRAVLQALAAQVAARRDELAAQEQAKRSLLERVQAERAAYEQVVRELEQASYELEGLIRQAQRRPARVAEARVPFGFSWPARGVFTSGFGVRRHPLFGIQHLHRGVDIAAPYGAPVVAAAAGRVIYAGWFGGYGKIVILDHGGGVSTLYGHLSAILVKPFDVVRRSQVIGRVGSTGYSTGPHVHFEIRIDGVAVNPDRL